MFQSSYLSDTFAGEVAKPTDVWRELTKTVVGLIRGLKAEGERRCPAHVAEAALSAFADVPGIEAYRLRLEQLVRDMSDAD